MALVWAPRALADMREIWLFISEDNPPLPTERWKQSSARHKGSCHTQDEDAEGSCPIPESCLFHELPMF